jgi:hypothetical protein
LKPSGIQRSLFLSQSQPFSFHLLKLAFQLEPHFACPICRALQSSLPDAKVPSRQHAFRGKKRVEFRHYLGRFFGA